MLEDVATFLRSTNGTSAFGDIGVNFTHMTLLNQRPSPSVEGVKKTESGIHIGSRAVLFERGSVAAGLWEFL